MNIQLFNNPEFGNVRVIVIDDEAYFVGKDVATALGYSNPNDALSNHVPDKFKRVSQIATPYGVQNMVVISEAGMYKLVFRSKLPNAEKFSDWACEEVLPSIRKNGLYVNPQAVITPDVLRQIADRIEQLEQNNAVLSTQVAELQPKATYYDIVLNCKDLVSTSQIAKDYGLSAKTFNKILHKLKIEFKQGDVWLLYQKYARLGWTQTKTHTYFDAYGHEHCHIHTYWTQKGRLGLYELLKKHGYYPTIERIG